MKLFRKIMIYIVFLAAGIFFLHCLGLYFLPQNAVKHSLRIHYGAKLKDYQKVSGRENTLFLCSTSDGLLTVSMKKDFLLWVVESTDSGVIRNSMFPCALANLQEDIWIMYGDIMEYPVKYIQLEMKDGSNMIWEPDTDSHMFVFFYQGEAFSWKKLTIFNQNEKDDIQIYP